MNALRFITLITIPILLIGCASTQPKPSSIDAKKALTVYIESNIKLPPSLEYYGPESINGALIGGVIGSLISQSGAGINGASLELFIKENHINLGEICLNSFKGSISQSKKIQVISDSTHDTRLSLEIIEFGFDKGWGLSNVKPLIKVRVKLFNSQKVIWEETESISGWTSETAARPIDKWLEDPEQFKRDIAYAFSLLSQLQLQSL